MCRYDIPSPFDKNFMLAVSGMSMDAGLLLRLSYRRCLKKACEHSNLTLFKATNGEDCCCAYHCLPSFELLLPPTKEVSQLSDRHPHGVRCH